MNTDSGVILEVTTNAMLLPPHRGFENKVFVCLHNVVNELAEDQNGIVTYLGTFPDPHMSKIELKPSCFCSHHISQHLDEFFTDTRFCRMLSEKIAVDCASLPQPFSVTVYVKVIRDVRVTLSSIVVRSKDMFQRLLEEQTVELTGLGDEEETTCSICMEEFSESRDDNIILLPDCFHLFHQSCIFEWLKRQRSCPLCRRVPYEEDHETE
ncbi:unnamed protein product [Arabidopsis arenosa]|uniref:RING-type domain-containing protein n=1 Tax=Arabidopsis arenosa TaxID=38785 RepID=A0A8S2AVP3_ARAAE|nr:unnamed protein product [Arabidopsis arenosa]